MGLFPCNVGSEGTTQYRTFRLTKGTDFIVNTKVGDAIAIAYAGNHSSVTVDGVVVYYNDSTAIRNIGFDTWIVDASGVGLIASVKKTHIVKCATNSDSRVPICTCPM